MQQFWKCWSTHKEKTILAGSSHEKMLGRMPRVSSNNVANKRFNYFWCQKFRIIFCFLHLIHHFLKLEGHCSSFFFRNKFSSRIVNSRQSVNCRYFLMFCLIFVKKNYLICLKSQIFRIWIVNFLLKKAGVLKLRMNTWMQEASLNSEDRSKCSTSVPTTVKSLVSP